MSRGELLYVEAIIMSNEIPDWLALKATTTVCSLMALYARILLIIAEKAL